MTSANSSINRSRGAPNPKDCNQTGAGHLCGETGDGETGGNRGQTGRSHFSEHFPSSAKARVHLNAASSPAPLCNPLHLVYSPVNNRHPLPKCSHFQRTRRNPLSSPLGETGDGKLGTTRETGDGKLGTDGTFTNSFPPTSGNISENRGPATPKLDPLLLFSSVWPASLAS